MRNHKLKTYFIIIIISSILFIGVIFINNKIFAQECGIDSIIFSPSKEEIDKVSWFNRHDRPTFDVTIKGKNCSGKTLKSVSLVNTAGINDDAAALDSKPVTFSEGSNEIVFKFKAGEEGCTESITERIFLANCMLEFRLDDYFGDTVWSSDFSGDKGKLWYNCDRRFGGSCNGEVKFELLSVIGGRIGEPDTRNSICAYASDGGTWACIGNSNLKASQNKCNEVRECQEWASKDRPCRVVDPRTQCTSPGNEIPKRCAFVQDNKYSCIKDSGDEAEYNRCNSLSECRSGQCRIIDKNQCGQLVTGSTGNPTGRTGETITYQFEIPNPIETEDFTDLVNQIGRFIFNISIPLAVILIIYSGILFLTSQGDQEKVTKAKKALTYTLIGLTIVLIGKGFISLIKSILELRAGG